MGSADRRAIGRAADKVDRLLHRDAQTVGESRSGHRRIIHEPPLGIIFSVHEEDRTVVVLDVWRYSLHD
jgi:hypothetical protein